jgi:hypothetical protein
MVPYYSDNRSKATANTCADPDSRRDVFFRFKTDHACTLLVIHGNFTNRTASSRRCFIHEFLPYQLSTVVSRTTVVVTGDGELGSIPEREPEKRLPHPRKAAGAQITQS